MDDARRSVQQYVAIAVAGSALWLGGCVVAPYPAPPPPPAYQTYQAPQPAYEPPAYGEAPAEEGAIQASEAPPPLPDYDQPPCPEDGYIWTPGYWGFASGGYYWVPGTWVAPPQVGYLWTPGYWGLVGAAYVFHPGYWGPHVGFYGGVHYGYGYTGEGYVGGHWDGGRFAYNRSVTNVNVTVVHNTYNETVINNVNVNKVSYNGGPGGVRAEPTGEQRQWAQQQHVGATPLQAQHVREAASNPAMFSRANGGRPGIAATPRPAAFSAPGAVGAHGASPPTPVQPSTQPAVQQHGFAPAPSQPGGMQRYEQHNPGQNQGQWNAGHPTAPPTPAPAAAVAQPHMNATYRAPAPPPAAQTRPQQPAAPANKAPPPHGKDDRKQDDRR
jgi:YXWGXW repeat-containing protein